MIEFRNVSQSYKDHKVLTDINMTIQSGEFVVLIGSSGCGKTTCSKPSISSHPWLEGTFSSMGFPSGISRILPCAAGSVM